LTPGASVRLVHDASGASGLVGPNAQAGLVPALWRAGSAGILLVILLVPGRR